MMAAALDWRAVTVPVVDGLGDTRLRAGVPYNVRSLGELLAADKPTSVPKERALAFLPSLYAANDARSHAAQREHGQFVALVGDIDHGNLSLPEVADQLAKVAQGSAWTIYSTASARPDDRRWRIIVPLASPATFDLWHDAQLALVQFMERNGLEMDACPTRPGQVAFLPNVPGDARSDTGEPLFFERAAPAMNSPGLDLSKGIIADCIADVRRKIESDNAERERIKAQALKRRLSVSNNSSDSLIESFNRANSVETLLQRYQYEQSRRNPDDWRSPNQTSKSFATRVIEGGKWISLSGSDCAAGVGQSCSAGCFGDAFDLFSHYEFGGDIKAALRQLGRERGTNNLRPTPPANDYQPTHFFDPETGEILEGEPSGIAGHHTQPDKQTRSKFEFIHVGDMDYGPPDWLIDGLFETENLGLLFGDPEAGKSFVAVDIGLCVASGESFHGRAVKRGTVFYIAGEGHKGLARRFNAWGLDRGLDVAAVPLFTSRKAAQFLDAESAGDVADAVAELSTRHGAPALIIIDTLARNFGGGDENSTSDMSAFVAAIDELKGRFPGCCALIVHHSGHGEKNRARGAMALKGALDCEFRLQKEGDTRRLVNTKMKDAEAPPSMAFVLRNVELPKGGSSAVLDMIDAPERKKALTGAQLLARDTFIEAAQDGGEFARVHLDGWQAAFLSRHTGDNDESKKRAFRRARAELVELGLLSVTDDVYQAECPTIIATLRGGGQGRT